MSSVQLQPQIQDKKNQVTPAFYKTVKVQPSNNNIASFISSQQTIQFEIAGNNVYNFSKFSISFLRGIPLTNATNGNNYFIPNNYCPFFNRIETWTSSNVRLVDVNNVHIYSKMAGLLNLNFTENTSSQGMIYPSNRTSTSSLSTYTGTTGQNGLLNGDTYINSQISQGTSGNDFGLYYRSLFGYSNNDASFATVANGDSTASNFKNNKKYTIQLSDILPDSFFAIDKDIYISETMYIKFTLNTLNYVLFEIGNGSGTVANTYSGILANPTTTSLPATNWTLLTYIQANEMVKSAVIQENESMSSLIIPLINMNYYSIGYGAGLKGSIFKVLASTLNSRLYKIYSILISNLVSGGVYLADTLNSCNILLDSYNTAQAYELKYNYINLYFNNNFIIGLDVQSNDDLSHIMNQFKNNSFIDEISYKDNSVIAHVFDSQAVDKNQYDGLTMRGEQFPTNNEHSINWQYQILPTQGAGNNANGFTNYQCAVVLSEIYILKGRFSLNPFV